jgi:glycosyltransferase involved in cell wall biosynthesis
MSERPIRILQIVGGMNRGGVETWLMHVLRHIDRSRYQMDFLVHTEQPCAYDDEIRTLGSRIIPCMHPSRPLAYGRRFKEILRQYGPYDVVHSHVHHFSGYTLWLAHQAGVPKRVAHSHSDTSRMQMRASLPRRAYLQTMKLLMRRYATDLIGVSRQSAAALFGEGWRKDERAQVLYCGIDLTPFCEPPDRQIRSEFGIPQNAFVVGHVGSFVPVKNHRFLIEIGECLISQNPDIHLLLVGDGLLRQDIQRQVHASPILRTNVHFAGLRGDIPKIMVGAMDVFVMSSHYEGIPLVLLEAQAAGLPCVITDVISDELEVVKPLFHRVSLLQPPGEWAAIIDNANHPGSQEQRAKHLPKVFQSPFNLEYNLERLEHVYNSPV